MAQCPTCGQPMAILEWKGIEADHCLACGGLWLDSGELGHIAAQVGVEVGSLSEAAIHGEPGEKGKRRCPRCGRKMQRVQAGTPGKGVELDRCSRGDGFWMDRGELRALIEAHGAAGRGEETAVARFLDELFGFTS